MIEYKRNYERSHGNLLSKNLMAFNYGHTGKTESEILNIYIYENKKLVGYCQTESEWHWVYITEIFYNNMKVLSELINQTSHHYSHKVEGLSYLSNIKTKVDQFKMYDFHELVSFENMPKGHINVSLINTVMSKVECHDIYEVICSAEEDESLKVQIKEAIGKHDMDSSKIEIMFDALDNDKFIGGVYGYIQYDYLYISSFWVSDEYRGQGIGSKLINEIEKATLDEGVRNIYLETVTFQAKEFYEKLGYELIAARSNCPKGHEDFTMIKFLK